MIDTPSTLFPPALRQGWQDRRLTTHERYALGVLWQHLSAQDWRPMKSEAFARLIDVRRENAARILRRLVETGYLVMTQPHPREPRLFLLVNHVPAERVA